MTRILQVVGVNFLLQANTPTFLAQINNQSLTLLSNELHRPVQLLAAVTPKGTKDIAGEAFRVQSNQNILSPAEISHTEGEMLLVILSIVIIGEFEFAVLGWNTGADGTVYGKSRHNHLSYDFQLKR